MLESIILHRGPDTKSSALCILVFVILCIILVGCLDSPDPMDNSEIIVHVTKVIDGDTILGSFPNESLCRIRFLGIDCPETSIQKNNAYEYDNITNIHCLTEYGREAKIYLESLINDSQVSISFDDQSKKKDQYGRYLCYVYVNSTDVNALLVKKGYARVYTLESFTKKSDYLILEIESIKQSRGLWNCLFLYDIIISTAHYDAAGNDEQNLNDEFIVIENTNDKKINCTGWSIRDDHGNQFYFPNGFSLSAHTSVTIYTGRGSNSTHALYWHHQTPVWNNDGDRIRLYNEKGIIIETYSW